MLSLNINKLRSEVEAREQRKTKIYDKILELCNNKILNSNQKNDDYACTYIVPNVVFGLPLYDVNECVKYIMDKLVEKGFDIYFALPTTIHISWKPADKYNSSPNLYGNLYLNPQQYKRLEAPRQQNQQNQQIQKYAGHNNDYTNTTSNDKQLTISNSYRKKIVNSNSNSNGNEKQSYQQHSQQQPQKPQYRPIDDYTQSNQTIYDLDDLDIFKNKLDNLFD